MTIRTRIAALVISAASLIAVSRPACAQWIPFTGSHVVDASNVPIANAFICALATDNLDSPIKVNVGGTKNAIIKPVCSTITAGVIASGYQVADPATSFPTQFLYRVTIVDLDSGDATIYKEVPVVGPAFSRDTYLPPYTGALVPFVYETGPAGPAGTQGPTGLTGPSGGIQVTGIQGKPVTTTAPHIGEAPAWNGSVYMPATSGSVNVKLFGAVGDGTADDTTAISAALAYEASNGGCIFFPKGAYKTNAELDWTDQPHTLCLRGENYRDSYIIYLGTSAIDAAVHVGNPSGSLFASVDITHLGIAANAHASYAFHAIRVGPPANLDTDAFMGGAVSSFQGDFWNGQTDLRNLIVTPTAFRPTGAAGCVNGISFGAGPGAPFGLAGTYPSGQFTLTMPNVGLCTGIGLNLSNTTGVTVDNAQLSGNHQNVLQNCTLGANCQANGVTFTDMLLENGSVPSQFLGGYDRLSNVLGSAETFQFGGQNNSVERSVGTFAVLSGAMNNRFENNIVFVTSSDAGTGTYGSGNLWGSGGDAPSPWNSLPYLRVRGASVLPTGTDLHTLTACGTYSVYSPVNGPTALAGIYQHVQLVCGDPAVPGFLTLIAQGYFGPSGSDPNIEYISTNVSGTWSSWEAFQFAGGPVTGPATAPSGHCSVIGWVFSQDGHATFCNGSNWVGKL